MAIHLMIKPMTIYLWQEMSLNLWINNSCHHLLLLATQCQLLQESLLRKLTNHEFNRGAKTAMTIALKHPERISNIIAVDNAPIDAVLASGFGSYVRGMKKIENARVTRLSDADKILQEVEEVCFKRGE